jgi:hypothetical protein
LLLVALITLSLGYSYNVQDRDQDIETEKGTGGLLRPRLVLPWVPGMEYPRAASSPSALNQDHASHFQFTNGAMTISVVQPGSAQPCTGQLHRVLSASFEHDPIEFDQEAPSRPGYLEY